MRLYRAALRLLPPGFRRAYGSALETEAATRLEEASDRGERRRVWWKLTEDLLATIVLEWVDETAHAVRNGMGGGMRTDLRQALRGILRTPGFALAVVGTLALGIGATAAALGLVDAYLLRSLPFPEGEKLVALWPSENWSRQMVDLASARAPSLRSVAGVGGLNLVLQGGGEPEEVFAAHATANLFDVLGVQPALGRGFAADDALPGAEPVTVLSSRIWLERFGGDPSVLGRVIGLGGAGSQRRTVIGVMPEGYHPLQGEGVDVWVPVLMDPADGDYHDDYFMQAVGRLASGATLVDATRDVRAFADRMQDVQPGWFTPERAARATAPPLAHERTGDRRTPLLVALASALLVLLVACANVANLIVARTTRRDRELSVRAALGSGRLRMARTVLTEVSLLALSGGVAGLLLSWGLVGVLERWFPAVLPDWGLNIDPRWVAATLALSVLSAMVAGAVPCLHAARRDPARAIARGRGTSERRALTRVQRLLSAIQLAMATAGIAAMGLLGRSLQELAQVDPGFRTAGTVTFRVSAPPSEYPTDEDVLRFFRDARLALAEVPGVTAVGFGSRLPLAGGDSRVSVEPEGWEFAEGDARPVAWHRLVTPGYLEAMGMTLLAGRIPTEEDARDGAPELAVINQAAAEAFWPDEPAVGKVFYGPERRIWLTVAGVVGDVMENGQARPILPGLYVPHRDWPWRTMYAVVHTRQDALALVPELRSALRSVSAGAPVSRVATLGAVASRGLRPTRTLAALAAIAAAVALLLGTIGIYGVMSQAAAGRARELGVRAALGAGRTRLLRGELSGATRIVAGGLGAGVLLAWLTGRALEGMLHNVSSFDMPSLGGALIVLGSVAYMAAWLPARRASGVDPVRIMREE
jgi:predicted permease